jgi:glycine/D-amino acid oxidase-like deaminating enzyme/nitrite reductase/ring-hydroxylating ferredoxin subunit
MESSERSRSVWKATAPLRQFAPLVGSATADVCVVGAGIAGMTTAYLLAKAGKRVIVLDDNAVGGGESGQTTAHLSSALDDRYTMLEQVLGKDRAKLAYESHQEAIEKIGAIVAAEGIDCDYERLDGYLFLAPEHTPELLDDELTAAHRAGFTDVERLPRAPVSTFDTGPCLRFPRQGQFHPLKYLNGLADAFVRLGGTIHTGSHVTELEGGTRAKAGGDGFSVTAGAVVVATNSPISDLFSIHTKQFPYRTFVIAAKVLDTALPRALYWDTGDPYHYVRLQDTADGPVLIVGGEDHKTGHHDDAPDRWRALEEWTRARFPISSVEQRWSGQVLEPADYMAYIGPDPNGQDGLYVATGDSGHGMTHGTIAGMLLSDLILLQGNPWKELYDPARKSFAPGPVKEFIRENLDVALKYGDVVLQKDVDSADQIAPGTGAILRHGTHPVAAYRDDDGTLHQCSALCTHLKCVVQWNSAERSWDCPCHGSRFTPTGEVLNGPASAPLSAVHGEAGA